MYKEGMTLAELVKTKDSIARANIDNFIIDNSMREHVENTYLPLEARLDKLTASVRKLDNDYGVEKKLVTDARSDIREL